MQAKKSGVFRSLFGKKQPESEGPPTLPETIAAAAGNCLSGLSGASIAFAVEQTAFESFRRDAAAVRQGYLLNCYGGCEQFDLSYFFPETFVLSMLEAIRRRDPSCDEERAGREILAAIAGQLPAGLFMPNAGETSVQLATFAKKYESKHLEELIWRAASCRIHRIFADGGDGRNFFYVLIDDEKAEALARQDEANPVRPAFIEALRLPLRCPREFVAGCFALLPRVRYGKHTADALFESIDAAPDADAYRSAAGVWIKMSCSLTPASAAGKPSPPARPWTTFLFFPAADTAKAIQLQKTGSQLAGVFFKEQLVFFKAVLGAVATRSAIEPGSKPEFESGAGFTAFKGAIAIGENRLACEVFVGLETWRWLGRLFRDPWEAWYAARAGAETPLSLLLSLNQSLLRRQIETFHRRFVDLDGQGENLPFSIFMDLLGERDARIVVQNHVLHSLGTRGIRSLFCHAERTKNASGEETVRIVTPRSYDAARLKAIIPAKSIEDWNAVDPAGLGTAAELRSRSSDMLKSIHDAIRKGRLLVSPKADLILEKMFLPGARAETKKALEQALRSSLPFETLKTMTRPILQQFLNSVGDRSLCLALTGADPELGMIRKNISKKRYAQLMEEIGLVKRQLQQGTLDEDDILAGKKRIDQEARELLEEIARKAGPPSDY